VTEQTGSPELQPTAGAWNHWSSTLPPLPFSTLTRYHVAVAAGAQLKVGRSEAAPYGRSSEATAAGGADGIVTEKADPSDHGP
jgi:hypothetical protein